MFAPGCAQLHQFGTFLTGREPRTGVSGAITPAITLKSRSSTQCQPRELAARKPSGNGGPVSYHEVPGDEMSAESVVYYLNRVPESDPNDQTEWLLTALGQYTGAELRELLYVAEEPGFFELMRGVFALSDESRAVLQHFLETGHPPAMKAAIDPKGRLTIDHVDVEQRVKMLPVSAN